MLAALVDSPFRQFRPETDRRLTDGTEHFLGILSLKVGLCGRTGKLGRGVRSTDSNIGAVSYAALVQYISCSRGTVRYMGGVTGSYDDG